MCTSQNGQPVLKLVCSCLTIWYWERLASINIEQHYGARGLYNGRYVSPDTSGQSHHAMNTLGGGNRDGISRAICELTLPSALIPWRLLTSALIHWAGARPELRKTPAISDKSSLGLCGARPVQVETATNHCVRKSRFNPSLLTHYPRLPSKVVGVCVFVRLSKSMSSIPNNLLSPSSGSSWDSLICQRPPTARPGQPCVNKPGSVFTSQCVRVAGAVNQLQSPAAGGCFCCVPSLPFTLYEEHKAVVLKLGS